MTDLPRPCIVCGEPCQTGRCPEHPAKTPPRPSRAIGYNAAWDRLSRRARALQPFCTDCGTTHNLTQPVRVAADILGHAQVRMTTDVYQRSSLVERQTAAAAIEAVVLGES